MMEQYVEESATERSHEPRSLVTASRAVVLLLVALITQISFGVPTPHAASSPNRELEFAPGRIWELPAWLSPAEEGAGPDSVSEHGAVSASLTTLDGAVVRSGSGPILQDGGTVTLPIEAINVENLGAVTVVVGYDPALLEVVECQRNLDFDFGLCNPQYDGAPDAVGFNELSFDGLSAAEENPLNLVDITWSVVGQPELGTVTTLDVQVLTFSDASPTVEPMSVSAQDGGITVTGRVKVDHIMTVASHLGQPAGDSTAQYDLVPDDVINAQDLGAFAGFWREMWP